MTAQNGCANIGSPVPARLFEVRAGLLFHQPRMAVGGGR